MSPIADIICQFTVSHTIMCVFPLQDRDMTHRQSPCGDSMVGVGDGGKEVEGCVDQLMGLGESEREVYSNSAFEQWDSYWEDLTRYVIIYLCDITQLRLRSNCLK